MKHFAYDRIRAPIGEILIAVADDHLCALDFDDCEVRMRRLLRRRFGEFELVPTRNPSDLSTPIRAYLEGEVDAISSVPILSGGSPFQEKAWAALRTIPPGTTATYGEQAARLGQPGAARAVGLANSLNPIAIVVPCHRVIGASGDLTGFAGGIERKQWLLAHERKVLERRHLAID
jgi:methylated-DNA-[protein]-cysteine S-methyltransferase